MHAHTLYTHTLTHPVHACRHVLTRVCKYACIQTHPPVWRGVMLGWKTVWGSDPLHMCVYIRVCACVCVSVQCVCVCLCACVRVSVQCVCVLCVLLLPSGVQNCGAARNHVDPQSHQPTGLSSPPLSSFLSPPLLSSPLFFSLPPLLSSPLLSSFLSPSLLSSPPLYSPPLLSSPLCFSTYDD